MVALTLQAQVSRWGLEESEARVHGVTGGTVNGRERAAGDRCTHEAAREPPCARAQEHALAHQHRGELLPRFGVGRRREECSELVGLGWNYGGIAGV